MGLHFETPESGPAYAAIRSKRMKKSLITIALAICAFSANAACTGSGSYRYCTDSSGNSYTTPLRFQQWEHVCNVRRRHLRLDRWFIRR